MLGFQERSNHKIKGHLCAYAVPPAIDEECSPSYITTSTIIPVEPHEAVAEVSRIGNV